MKLGKYLIVTVSDFARHFTFQDFWENRKQFVRDMHPDKVYYWSEELKQAYFDVADWINGGDNMSEAMKHKAINSLEKLSGREIDMHQLDYSDKNFEYSSPIIHIKAGQTIDLPEYKSGVSQEVNLSYHKIEVYGKSLRPAIIRIGKNSISLSAGEFIYVTAQNDLFIEFMPLHLQNDKYDMYLGADVGIFLPILYVRDLETDNLFIYKNVVSFALTMDGYVYVDENKKLVVESIQVYNYRASFDEGKDIFYVKSNMKDCIILHNDGMLENLRTGDIEYRIISVAIDSDIVDWTIC